MIFRVGIVLLGLIVLLVLLVLLLVILLVFLDMENKNECISLDIYSL
jgi:hypothetical protein